jgi:hypothetical protein
MYQEKMAELREEMTLIADGKILIFYISHKEVFY